MNTPSRQNLTADFADDADANSQLPSPSAPLCLGGNPIRLTEKALALGAERCFILHTARAMKKKGAGLSQIARCLRKHQIQSSPATLCNLLKNFGHLEDHEITPENLAGRTGRNGSKSTFLELAQNPEVQKKLQSNYLYTCGASCGPMTKGRHTGSIALTIESFADDPLCPPHLADKLRDSTMPSPFVRIIRKVTDYMEQYSRGSKHASLNAQMIIRTELKEVLEDGTRVPITPGDWWVFDDMSSNAPFWFVGPDDKPVIGRQGLYVYDVCRRWLAHELVGTSRDSYTAAIILRFVRRLMEAYGKPRRGIVLERSVWQSNAIRGFRLTVNGTPFEEETERAGMPAEEVALLEDGLKALGIRIHYTYTPRGKEIEGAFNYYQKVFRLAAKNATQIGRHAGEDEHGAKQARRAAAGSFHPDKLGFLHIDEHADLGDRVMQWVNRHTARRKPAVYGPAEYPRLAALSARDHAAFLPNKFEVQIRQGKVSTTLDGILYEFCASQEFGSFGSGYRVAGRFDASEPQRGAAIYNAETSTMNHNGLQVGEFICWAELLEAAPRFDASKNQNPAYTAKREFARAVRTAFRAVGMVNHRAGTSRDGKGTVVEVTGARAETPAPAAPRAPEPMAAPKRRALPEINLMDELVERAAKAEMADETW